MGLVVAAAIVLAWAVATPSTSVPLGSVPGACADPLPMAQGGSQSGCCHYDGGVCGCDGGRPRCCDGKVSASCRCGAPPAPTRQARFNLQPLIAVEDAAFAAQNIPEPPSRRLNWFKLGDDLWLWVRLLCSDSCWNELAPAGPLALELRWLFDPGNGPLPRGESQQVALAHGQRVAFVRRPTDQLKPGRWETEIRFDTERLCTREGHCWFPIDVKP
jgi:hypothetical protein